MMHQADDQKLVQLLAKADRAAFEYLFKKHNRSMVKLAQGIVRSRAIAEEIAQDSWMSVLSKVGDFEGRSSLAGWIFSIVVNKAKTVAKRNGRTVSFDDNGEENGLAAAFDGNGRWKDLPALWYEVTPEQIADGRKQLHTVTAAMETLPDGQKSVLLLRVQEGLETPEVAHALGITEGNVRILLHRARLALRAALDKSL